MRKQGANFTIIRIYSVCLILCCNILYLPVKKNILLMFFNQKKILNFILENKKIKIFVDYGLKLRYNAILQGYILKGGFSLC